jgi:hypothetical protein
MCGEVLLMSAELCRILDAFPLAEDFFTFSFFYSPATLHLISLKKCTENSQFFASLFTDIMRRSVYPLTVVMVEFIFVRVSLFWPTGLCF